MDIYTLLNVKSIASVKQPHSTGRSAQCYDRLEGWDRKGGREGDARGKRYRDVCICMADSLFYKAETNTLL